MTGINLALMKILLAADGLQEIDKIYWKSHFALVINRCVINPPAPFHLSSPSE